MPSITDRELIRPSRDELTDGVFEVYINRTDVQNTGNGKKLRLDCWCCDLQGLGLEAVIFMTPDWKPGSPFRKLLELANCLPECNEPLDVDALVDKTVMFTINVSVKNGRGYPNVIDVALPPDED